MSYNAVTADAIATAIAASVAATKPVAVTMASAVTTVSNASPVELKAGPKAFTVKLAGTGAVSATVQIQVSSNTTDWLASSEYTFTLAGTTEAFTGSQESDSWRYHRVAVTQISGTGAAVTVIASV